MDYWISRFNSFSLGTEGVTRENILAYIKKDFQFVPDSEVLVICLPGWGGELNKWKIVKKYIVNARASFLAYEFPRGIFSDHIDDTKALFEIINRVVRSEITTLKKEYGFKKCILVGVSLASSYGSTIYKDNADIDEIILIAPGENLARDMWHGCRTQHFRRSYENQGTTEVQIIKSWEGLASQNNFPVRSTRIHLFFGSADKVIPYEFSHTLTETYKKKNLDVTEKVYPLGHYFLISFFLLFPKGFLILK